MLVLTKGFYSCLTLLRSLPNKKALLSTRTYLFIACASVTVSGCLSSIDNEFFSTFEVEYPEENKFDTDTMLTRDDILESAKPIKITYPEDTELPLNVYFNGRNVSDCYTFNKTEATAQLFCMRENIRQGENTISINPGSLFKGTTRTFLLDTEGPQINIIDVCFQSSADCTQADTGNVQVVVKYIDPSVTESTVLNDLDPVSVDGVKRTFIVPVSDEYRFISMDSNQYESVNIYKADGQRVAEVAKVRVAENLLGEFLPLINSSASGMESGQPDGSGEPVIEDITIDILGIKLAADVKYIKVGTMDIQSLAIEDTPPYPLSINMYMEPLGEENVDWFDQNDMVEDVGDVGVEVLLHMRDYTQCWDGLGCGWLGLTEAIPCPIKGWARCNYGITINMDMRMYIERIKIESAIDLVVNQGDFDIKLNKKGDQNVITMHDVKASLTGEETSGGEQQGFIDGIISSPVISGLIKGIVEDTINRNMEELKLEKTFDFDTGAEMKLSGRVETMRTGGGDGDNIGNLYVDLSGVFETITPDRTIKPALGSYYVDDRNLPSQVDKGSSLAVIVNSNIVNQGLLAMYNTGATHLSMLNQDMHTGLGVTDDMGENDDIRVELNPSSPGEFFITGDEVNQAYIAFRGAEMTISKKSDDAWKVIAGINIDIKAGVQMDVADGFLTMTIAGTPEYKINSMGMPNGNPEGTLSSKAIEFLVKRMIEWGIPFVADSELRIDVSKAGISDKLYTESVDSNNGHLDFETSVKDTL